LLSLLAFAAFARAQSIVGTYYIPNDGPSDGNDIVPDVSVIGIYTITDTADVGLMTIQTVPNPTTTTTTTTTDTEPKPATGTVTQCWKLLTAESSTTRVAVLPTLVEDGSVDIQCWLVYQGDGGIIGLPIPQTTDASSSHSDPTTNLALPIVLSLVGVVLLAGGILTFFHVRNKRRRAANSASSEKRAWVNRKAGWANTADEQAGITHPDVAQVTH